MNWWHAQLEGLSKTLMNGVIGFCEKTVTNAKTEISDAQDQLKEVTTDTQFSSINKSIETNEKTQVNELTQRKNRILPT